MNKALALAESLISRQSVTPNDAGCMDIIINRLQPFGFKAERLDFGDTQNLWLRRGESGPLFVFAGHTDVVPSGPVDQWDTPPFEPTYKDGLLYGRGSADMKSSIAAMVVACEQFLEANEKHFEGSIAFLLTSDEEGPATNGTVKVIETLEQRNEKIDWCLVGEPSSSDRLGDTLRVGRRGSLCAEMTIKGIQGHVAYPELADNPIHRAAPALAALTSEIWDEGNQYFPPTSLQVSNINAGTGAENIIPGELRVSFNLRFSTEWTAERIKERISEILDAHQLEYEINWRLSGNPFLTKPGTLVKAAQNALKETLGQEAHADTGGGTSDGRFIAPTGAQVIELGPINKSIHKINEHVKAEDVGILSSIYESLLNHLFLADHKENNHAL